MLGACGVGPEAAATLLVAAGDNPERMAGEASLRRCAPLAPSRPPRVAPCATASTGAVATADNALWRIAMVRLRCDERTIAYADRRRAQGKTPREIIRCLKRHIAREIHRLLTDPPAVPDGADLRRLRHRASATLEDAARALGACTNRLSELERGTRHNRDLAIRYHNWLTNNPT